jgi:hypothetical protein
MPSVDPAGWGVTWELALVLFSFLSPPTSFPVLLACQGPCAQRQGAGHSGWGGVGEGPSQAVLFCACGDQVWCLFLKKIDAEPLFIAGDKATDRGFEAVQAPARLSWRWGHSQAPCSPFLSP